MKIKPTHCSFPNTLARSAENPRTLRRIIYTISTHAVCAHCSLFDITAESRTCENINGRLFFIARLIRPPNLPTNGRDTKRLESCLRTQCYCWGSTVEYTHSAVNSHNVRPHGDLMHRGIRRATQGIIRVRFLQRQINTFRNVHRVCVYEKREGPICERAYCALLAHQIKYTLRSKGCRFMHRAL
jgi:hypothetical protein